MDKIIAIVDLGVFVALVVGLVKPSAVLGFMKKKTRGRVLLVYGLPFFLIPFWGGMPKGPQNSPSPPPSSQSLPQHKETPIAQDPKGGNALDGIPNEAKGQPVKTIDLTQGELFQDLAVQRDKDGGLQVVGKSLLPEGTKLWVTLGKKGQKDAPTVDGFIDASHNLISPAFSPYPEGQVVLKLEAHFNGAWQTNEVLAITGEGGTNVPAKYSVPDDPEFPSASRYIDLTSVVLAPPISPEIQAILAVKRAKLNVKGSGQSSETVEGAIKIFASAPGFTPQGWFSKPGEGGKWIVSLTFIDGQETKTAAWEYDPKTKAVRYADPMAKMLSYVPPE